VNLDQSEVSGLISDMNGSVKDAIDSGYLYMVSPAPNSSDTKSQTSDDGKSSDDDDDDATAKSDKVEHTDKKFDIEQSMKDSKMFYTTDTTSTAVDMVIKNTGYNISNVIYIAAAMLFLTVLVVVLTIRYDLFAPADES
jgi:cell division protein FtsX